MRILILDDDRLVSESVSEMLAALSHDVTRCSALDEALRSLAGATRHDVLLIDINLERGERGERIAEMAAALKLTLPPIVIFSARPADEVRTAAAQCGARSVLRKPCSILALEKALVHARAAAET
jgi:DNA-binding response OmpR family regulator